MLDQKRLLEIVDYQRDAGVFTRKTTGGYRGCHKAGKVLGSKNATGHVLIGVEGVRYYAHRLAWLYVHGAWPKGVVDHINGDPSDNRICNLRAVSQAVNTQNTRRARSDNASSGLLGVERRGGSFRARIQTNGVVINIGSFKTAEDAQAAYVEAKRRVHPGCAI